MRVLLPALFGLYLIGTGTATTMQLRAAQSTGVGVERLGIPGDLGKSSDEHAISLQSTVGTGLVRHVVATDGGIVAGVYSELYVFESDDDGEVNHVSTLKMDGVVKSLEATPDTVTVTDSSGTLSLVDVANPHSASVVATIDPAIDGAQIHVGVFDGSFVYSVDVDVFRVFDATDFGAISLRGSLPLNIRIAHDIDVNDGHVYITTADEIVVITVEDALAPAVVATIPRDSGPWIGITTRGHLLYAASQSAGVFVYDVSDPSDPNQLAALDLDGISREPYLFSDHLLVPRSSYGGLHVVDINDPAAPTLISTMRGDGDSTQAVQVGSLGYVAVSGIGLQQIDLSDLVQPRAVEFILDGPGTTISVDAHGAVAYAMTFYGELFAYSITTPSSPTLLSRVNLEQKRSHDMARVGNRLFVVGRASSGSLVEVSTTDPTAPSATRAGSIPFIPSIITACGNRLLVGGTNGLASYDAAGDGRPSMIKAHTQEGLSIRAVTCSGARAFAIGIVANGVEILELDPWDESTAFIVSTWTHESLSRPSHLALAEDSLIVGSESNVLFLDTSQDELAVRDVSPELSQLKGFLAMGSEGDRVVANVTSQRIVSVDVSVPDMPRLAAESDERLLLGNDLAVDGRVIVAGLGQPGFQIYVDSSITAPPATPTPTSEPETPTPTRTPTATPSPADGHIQVFLPLNLTFR